MNDQKKRIPLGNQQQTHIYKDSENISSDEQLTAWLPSLLWMAFLFYLSSLPQIPGPEEILTIQIIRKTGHALVYAILCALNRRAFRKTRPSATNHTLWAWGLTVGYAIFDEIHQGFSPGRHATVHDVLIDALGATVAVLLMSRWTQASDRASPAAR